MVVKYRPALVVVSGTAQRPKRDERHGRVLRLGVQRLDPDVIHEGLPDPQPYRFVVDVIAEREVHDLCCPTNDVMRKPVTFVQEQLHGALQTRSFLGVLSMALAHGAQVGFAHHPRPAHVRATVFRLLIISGKGLPQCP